MSDREPDRLPPQVAGSLYLEFSRPLLAFAFGLLRDHDLALEVVQITFGKALEGGGSIPADARKAWLYRVAHNEAMQMRRRQGATQRVHQRLAAGGQEFVPQSPPERELVRDEEIGQVREALENLPDEQRLVVEKRIYGGQTFAAIAAELKLPLGTVLTRMRLALARLAQSLHDTQS